MRKQVEVSFSVSPSTEPLMGNGVERPEPRGEGWMKKVEAASSLRLRLGLRCCDKSDLRKDLSPGSTIRNLPRPNRRIRVGIG